MTLLLLCEKWGCYRHTLIPNNDGTRSKRSRSRRSKRKDTEVPQPSGPITNVVDEAVNKEMDDSLERATTTATSLDTKQDRGNIDKTQSKATVNEPSSSGTSSGSGPKRQETMKDTIAQTRFENVSKLSNDPLLARGNTLQSGEDRLKLEELMALCTTLQSRVLALETTKTTQATEIASLKKRVESSKDEGLGEEDASKQERRIHDIDANEDIYLVNVQTDEDMFGVNDLDGDEVIVESVDVVNTVEETRSVVEEVIAVTIPIKLKNAKSKATTITTTPTLTTTTVTTTITAISTRPRAKRIVFHDQEQAPAPTVSSQQPSQVKVKDKVKAKWLEQETYEEMFKERTSQRLDGRNLPSSYKLKKKKKKRLPEKKLNKLKKPT
ncbi:hypothetical protein Tco_0611435 [Tanacetum coccineum]